MSKDVLVERQIAKIDEAWMTVATHYRDRAIKAEAEVARLQSVMASGHCALVSQPLAPDAAAQAVPSGYSELRVSQ